MPYNGEHSARINPPGKYEKIRRQNNKFGKGIHAIFGILPEGGSEVQAIRFDSDLFSPEEAKAWLKEHDYKPIEFEPAAEPEEEGKETEQASQVHRYLAIELAPLAALQEVDGGLLVPGVRLLAPGTWTDSVQKTPCRYTEEMLRQFHANWKDPSYWSRHSGGTPRDITDRIADIRNIRYQDGVTADLYFHGATSKSLDAISLLKAAAAGKVPWPYSSVEMMTRDKWVAAEKLYEAQEVLFDGAAMVNQGACRTCRIRNNEEGNGGKPDETPPEEVPEVVVPRQLETDVMDTKELEAQVTAQDAKIKELEAALKAKPEVKPEVPKELMDTIKALTEKVKALESQPTPPKTTPEVQKELGEVETVVIIDKTAKTIRGV